MSLPDTQVPSLGWNPTRIQWTSFLVAFPTQTGPCSQCGKGLLQPEADGHFQTPEEQWQWWGPIPIRVVTRAWASLYRHRILGRHCQNVFNVHWNYVGSGAFSVCCFSPDLFAASRVSVNCFPGGRIFVCSQHRSLQQPQQVSSRWNEHTTCDSKRDPLQKAAAMHGCCNGFHTGEGKKFSTIVLGPAFTRED